MTRWGETMKHISPKRKSAELAKLLRIIEMTSKVLAGP